MMINKHYLKYLSTQEREQVQVLEKKIRHAKTVAEVEAYREQIGLIMTNLVRRYKKYYRSSRMKKVADNQNEPPKPYAMQK